METDTNQRIIFDLPEDTITSDVINEIIKDNGLEENMEEYFHKLEKGEETRFIIIRDAALIIFEKKVPEEKLVEILANHLETSKEAAKKIVEEIKQKLVPYARVITFPTEEEEQLENAEVEEDLSVQEALIEKIKQGIPDDNSIPEEVFSPPEEVVKKVEVKDVEESAERMKKIREETARPGTTGGQIRKGQTDKYREAIDE